MAAGSLSRDISTSFMRKHLSLPLKYLWPCQVCRIYSCMCVSPRAYMYTRLQRRRLKLLPAPPPPHSPTSIIDRRASLWWSSLLSGVSVSAPCNGQYAYLKRVRLTPDVYPRLILFTLLLSRAIQSPDVYTSIGVLISHSGVWSQSVSLALAFQHLSDERFYYGASQKISRCFPRNGFSAKSLHSWTDMKKQPMKYPRLSHEENTLAAKVYLMEKAYTISRQCKRGNGFSDKSSTLWRDMRN